MFPIHIVEIPRNIKGLENSRPLFKVFYFYAILPTVNIIEGTFGPMTADVL